MQAEAEERRERQERQEMLEKKKKKDELQKQKEEAAKVGFIKFIIYGQTYDYKLPVSDLTLRSDDASYKTWSNKLVLQLFAVIHYLETRTGLTCSKFRKISKLKKNLKWLHGEYKIHANE